MPGQSDESLLEGKGLRASPRSAVCRLWLPVLILLSACSHSPEDRLVKLGRCFKAGTVLEDRVLLRGVEIALMRTIQDLKIEMSPAQFAMLIIQKIDDEL